MGKVISGLATEYCAIVPHREPNSTRWPSGLRPAPITPGTAGSPAVAVLTSGDRVVGAVGADPVDVVQRRGGDLD